MVRIKQNENVDTLLSAYFIELLGPCGHFVILAGHLLIDSVRSEID